METVKIDQDKVIKTNPIMVRESILGIVPPKSKFEKPIKYGLEDALVLIGSSLIIGLIWILVKSVNF